MQTKLILYIFFTFGLVLLTIVVAMYYIPKIVAQSLEINGNHPTLRIYMEHNPMLVAPNSTTKIIPVVQSKNLTEIERLMLYSISLSPSKELQELVKEIIINGTNSRECVFDQTIGDLNNLGIKCSTNPSNTTVIWDIFENDKSQWIIDLQNINILNIENHTKVFPAIASSE